MKSDNKNEEFSDAHASAKGLLAHNLKFYRKHAKLSQEDLGLKIGADQAYISRIEAGQLNPTIETLAELASALGVEVGSLLQWR